MFHVRPENHWQNNVDAQLLHAGEAALHSKSGTTEPGVAIFKHREVRFVLNSREARRLAKEINYKLELAERAHDQDTSTNHEGNNRP